MPHARDLWHDAVVKQLGYPMTSNQRQYEYTVLLDPDEEDGGYTVTVPALPGVVTQGETIDEALEMAKDAIALYLEDLVADGEPIPAERLAPQLAVVRVAA
jgi:antitoxin HicB